MCFRWLKRIYHFLRRKCSRRHRGYNREISLSHRGFCTGGFSGSHGEASFSYGREGSVTYDWRPSDPYRWRPSDPCSWRPSDPYSRGASSCAPLPAPAPHGTRGGFPCDTGGATAASSGDCGVSSGWDVTVGTVPVYGPGVGMGYGDLGPVVSSGELGGGSAYHTGDLGTADGYGYPAPLSDTPAPVEVSEGSGYHGGALGYGTEALPGPELGPAPVVQQKCPVVVPPIKGQQCKQSPRRSPIQKK